MLPEGHKRVHVGDEALVVVALKQVNHFMDDNIFQALNRLLD
jgi:hypothetical protein